MPKETAATWPTSTISTAGPSIVQAPKKINWKNIWKSLWKLLFLGLMPLVHRENLLVNSLAFLLGRISIMGELAPFGLAFFAAIAQLANWRAVGVAFWAIGGVLSTGRYYDAGIYFVGILAYFRLKNGLAQIHSERLAVPLFVFGVVILGEMPSALWQSGGLYRYVLVLFDALIAMILTYIFAFGVRVFDLRPREQQVSSEMLICLVLILAGAVAGWGTLAVFGYSLRNIFGSLAVMFMAFGGGSGLGTSVGVAVGLAVGLTDNNATTMISLYAIAGLLAGAFRTLGKIAVILGFLLGGVITVLQFGQDAELERVLVEAAIAAAVFLCVPVSWLEAWETKMREQASLREELREVVHSARAKLISIAELFDKLAAFTSQASTEAIAAIREKETGRFLAAVGKEVCGPCRRRARCWEHDYDRTLQAMLSAAALIQEEQLIDGNLARPLKINCLHEKEIGEIMNKSAERSLLTSFWEKKQAVSQQTVMEQFTAIGNIMANVAETLDHEPLIRQDIEGLIKDQAALDGCPVEQVKLISGSGGIVVEISKAPCGGKRECINKVLPVAATLLQRKLVLRSECADQCPGKKCRLSLTAAARFVVETGAAATAKEPRGVCGDTYTVIPFGPGKVGLIVSDGMGSGREAAGESGVTVGFLEKLLAAGFHVDLAVKIVNALLLLKTPSDSFVTIDMLIIDTNCGEAEFIKAGSAPSFVKRVREVATIHSATLPVGILNQMEIEPVKWLLADGDVIVMLSDGVVDLPGNERKREPWVVNFLRRTPDSQHPQEMANRILREAREMAGPSLRDDMTVLVAKVSARPSLEYR